MQSWSSTCKVEGKRRTVASRMQNLDSNTLGGRIEREREHYRKAATASTHKPLIAAHSSSSCPPRWWPVFRPLPLVYHLHISNGLLGFSLAPTRRLPNGSTQDNQRLSQFFSFSLLLASSLLSRYSARHRWSLYTHLVAFVSCLMVIDLLSSL